MVLECKFKSHDEGMIELLQDFSLNYMKWKIIHVTIPKQENIKRKLTSDALDLVSSNQYFFLDGFHGEYLPSNLMRYHVHFTIGSSAYCFEDLEVTLGYTCLYR